MIPDSEIPKCLEFEVESKIGKLFKSQNSLAEYSVKIYEIDPYFYEHYEKKLIDKNRCKYISFRIDIYFSGCFLAVEIDEKRHTDTDIIFEEKRQKGLEKKLNCKFIRTNTSNAKNGYDLDYEVSNVQALISSKIKKLKKPRRKIDKRKRNEKESRKRNERKIMKRTKRHR